MNEHIPPDAKGQIQLLIHTASNPNGAGPYAGFKIGAFAYRAIEEHPSELSWTVTHLGTGRMLRWEWREEEAVVDFLRGMEELLVQNDVEPHWTTHEDTLRALRPHKASIEALAEETGGIRIDE